MRGRLRAVARQVCDEYGIEPSRIKLVEHGFNTTFRIDTVDGQRFALRINVNSGSTADQIDAEVRWVEALQGRVGVARPMKTLLGKRFVSISGILDRPMHCVLYTWLDGKLAADSATPATLELLGATMAEMHRHAAEWSIPEDCRFKALPDLLYGDPFVLQDSEAKAVLDKGAELFERLKARPRIPVHYDLHLANAKVYRGRVFVFDFDDAVLAWPILDVAVALYYIREFEPARPLEGSFRKGLCFDPADHGVSEEELDVLVACRGTFVANDAVMRNSNSSPNDANHLHG